jgi:hypothetical protein
MLSHNKTDRIFSWKYETKLFPREFYSKRQRAEGRRQKAEGKRLTGLGFSIWLCPNRLGDCYNDKTFTLSNNVILLFEQVPGIFSCDKNPLSRNLRLWVTATTHL